MGRYWSDQQLDRATPPQTLDDRGRAVLRTLDHMIGETPISSFYVRDADTCPSEALPALIAERSMEEFIAPGLPENVQRRILKNAWLLQSLKGYDAGVKLGLGLLDMSMHIEHWWQVEPKREANTHTIDVFMGDDLFPGLDKFSKRQKDAILRMIDATKRISQESTVRIGERFNSTVTARNSAGLRLVASDGLSVQTPENTVPTTIVARHSVSQTLKSDDRLVVEIAPQGNVFIKRVVAHFVWGQSLAGGSSSGKPGSIPIVLKPLSKRALMYIGGVRSAYGLEPYDPAHFAEFVPAFEALDASGLLSDTGMTTLAERVLDGPNTAVLVSAFGLGGAPYPVIEDGTQPFANMVYALHQGKAVTEQNGQSFEVGAFYVRHGESEADESAASYGVMLRDFRDDAVLAAKVVCPNDTPPVVGLQQINRSSIADGVGAARFKISGPQEAVLQTVLTDEPGFFCAGPQYPAEFVDSYHPSPMGHNYLASQSGKAFNHYKKHGAWKPLHMLGGAIDGAWIIVDFDGSWLRLGGKVRINTSWVSDPGGFGFVYVDDAMSAHVVGAEPIGRTQMAVRLSNIVRGNASALGLAYWSAAPMGKQGRLTGLRSCVCDDHDDVCRTTGWSLENYALSQSILLEAN